MVFGNDLLHQRSTNTAVNFASSLKPQNYLREIINQSVNIKFDVIFSNKLSDITMPNFARPRDDLKPSFLNFLNLFAKSSREGPRAFVKKDKL
ncbi:hypothetical protein IQ66_01795 [Leptospira borgpetersenii serovar Ballum]|nr:hypothetical protein IQ66_01795 [Leptospira borgpetersenii serovar Ballum]